MSVPFHIERSQSVGLEAVEHRHPYCEIVYYENGRGTLTLNGVKHRVDGYQMCLISPMTPHGEGLTGNVLKYTATLPFVPRNAKINQLLEDVPQLELRSIFMMLLRLYSQMEVFQSNSVYYRLVEVLCELSQSVRSPRDEYPVYDILKALYANYTQADFTVGDVFQMLPVSEEQQRIRFKQATGCAPQEYLIGLRIRHACSLLQMADPEKANIKEIASLSGFSDPLYFSRIFKKRVGLSPSEYRDALQQD